MQKTIVALEQTCPHAYTAGISAQYEIFFQPRQQKNREPVQNCLNIIQTSLAVIRPYHLFSKDKSGTVNGLGANLLVFSCCLVLTAHGMNVPPAPAQEETKALDLDSAMEPYQDEPLLSVVGALAEGVDWISESSESAGENEIEIVASTSTVLADNGER
ncbi:hypothetical protein ACOMHN_063781 [Nucella lapillus]